MATTSSFGDRRSRVSFDRVELDEPPLGDRAFELSEGVELLGEDLKSLTWVYDIQKDHVTWSSPIEEFFGFEVGVCGFSVLVDNADSCRSGGDRHRGPAGHLTRPPTTRATEPAIRHRRRHRGGPAGSDPGPDPGRLAASRVRPPDDRPAAPTGCPTEVVVRASPMSGESLRPPPAAPPPAPPPPARHRKGPVRTTSGWSSTSPPSRVSSGNSASWSIATACSPRSPPMWCWSTRTGCSSTATVPLGD